MKEKSLRLFSAAVGHKTSANHAWFTKMCEHALRIIGGEWAQMRVAISEFMHSVVAEAHVAQSARCQRCDIPFSAREHECRLKLYVVSHALSVTVVMANL